MIREAFRVSVLGLLTGGINKVGLSIPMILIAMLVEAEYVWYSHPNQTVSFLLLSQCKHFKKDASLNGRKLKSSPLLTAKHSYIEDCVLFCESTNTCNSVSFNEELNDCFIYTKQLNKDSESAPGWIYFELDEKTPYDCKSDGYILEMTYKVCFKVHEVQLPYSDAQASCQAEGARLIVLDTNEKFLAVNNKIRALYPTVIGYLLGLDDIKKEGKWEWINGNAKGEHPVFNKNQPNDNDRRVNGQGADCAFACLVYHELHKQPDKIYDDNCDQPATFVCERLNV